MMLKDVVTDKKGSFDTESHSELRCQVNRNRSVGIASGNLIGNGRSEVSGVSARVYKNGVYGFSSMAEVTGEAAEKVLSAAHSNAGYMSMRVGKNVTMFPRINAAPVMKNCDISDPEQKLYIDYLKELDAYILKKYPSLSSRRLSARADSSEKYISVSDGAEGHTVIPRAYVYVSLTADGKDGSPIDLLEPFGGYGTFDKLFKSPDELYGKIDALYERLRHKCEGIYPEAGLKTCILGGCLAGMLSHEAVGHTVEADLVLGGSVAATALDKTVASPLVTMVDFANTYNGEPAPLPVYIDDEGVPAQDEVLIRDGVLVGYMNSRESAAHFGMIPRGNARAYAFSDEPLIRMRNTAILPGVSKLEDMIASVEDGYYFIDTNNGQADTTGEFMFGVCCGYEIKNGKLGRALLDTTITGVAFEMLKTVDMVSDTMTWTSAGVCGKKQPMPVGMGGPALRCKVTVGGR